MSELTETTQVALHWLRPLWLWMFLPIVVGAILLWRRLDRRTSWDTVVDPKLQPYVLEGQSVVSRRANLALLALWTITVVLLAGPVFEQRRLPVTEARRAEVLIMDLTRSMVADDLAPSRLARAKFKLGDILDRVDDDRMALIAFAERPYVISPLTDDIQTLEAFLPSLDPSLMPVQGSRLDLAIDKGHELLEGAGVTRGHLLLITDGQVDAKALDAATRARVAGHTLSVLAVGTRAGTALRDPQGGFANDERGQIVIPRLDLEALDSLARAGGGSMTTITSDDTDIILLERERQRASVQSDAAGDTGQTRSLQWIERGPWLVPLLALLFLFKFRRENDS